MVLSRRVAALVVGSALALAAGLSMLALMAKGAQAQAESEILIVREPLEFATLNPCAGETIFIEGTVQGVLRTTIDPNGGSHTMAFFYFQGKGVSISGAKYVVKAETFVQRESTNIGDDSAQEVTSPGLVHFIRQGETSPNDDFSQKVLLHTTINANGEITSLVADAEEGECK